MKTNVLAGKPASDSMLVNITELVDAYYSKKPDPQIAEQKVSFGTSGHRGSSLNVSFNENHILAISCAICQYRLENGISGPLFMGIDTHALSKPALMTALEVFAAANVHVMLSTNDEYTPTPAVSHAILMHNKGHREHLADGIVITPSHNPPGDGGFKYNPPSGGPADESITKWIETRANALLGDISKVKRMPFEKARMASTTHRYDFLNSYVRDLENVVDMKAIASSKVLMGVDPLGGAGVHYWQAIADRYQLNLKVVRNTVDSTFRFMSVDWDGKIRMDPSSVYAMQSLIGLKDEFDVAFACDTDHDRHGIVTKLGLLPSNHYLTASLYYLFKHRPNWNANAAVGKTLVSTRMIDKVAASLKKRLYEVPVGFKWFVDGLLDGSLGFVGEESAGAAFLKKDGSVWTTDKDGIIMGLLAGEMKAKEGKDPGELYAQLTAEFGNPFYTRIDAAATPEQKSRLKTLSKDQVPSKKLGGETITAILTKAPGNGASIGGLKVETENGWFAARPSGTENIYKIYAESFLSEQHLKEIVDEAQSIVTISLGI